MLGEQSDFLEGTFIDQLGYALARAEFPGSMLLVDALLASTFFNRSAFSAKVGSLLFNSASWLALSLSWNPSPSLLSWTSLSLSVAA
jgi:hypothetical protein